METIVSVGATVVETPLRRGFATAQDAAARTVSRRVRIELALSDGRVAVAEAVPVAYVTGESCEQVVATCKAAAPLLAGQDVSRPYAALAAVDAGLNPAPTARAGLEIALVRAQALVAGTSLWRMWGAARREVVTDITLADRSDAAGSAREAAAMGFHCFKVKVGAPEIETDLAMLRAIDAAVPHARFRLDANQGYTPDDALRFIERVLAHGIELEMVEQPVAAADWAGLDRVAAGSPVPVLADEAVKHPEDAERLFADTRVHGVNIKLMKSGIAGALEIIRLARGAGRKLMIGCMLESSLGISVSLALACGTGAFDYVDLDTHLLLREEPGERLFDGNGPTLRILGD